MENEQYQQNAQQAQQPRPQIHSYDAQATQQAPAALEGAQQPASVPAPKPYYLDRLAKNKDFVYKDKNGYDWHYTLQFPGLKKTYSMLDRSRTETGAVDRGVLYDDYLKNVVVSEHLDLDDFNTRPGLEELMDAIDTFLGDRIS